MLGAHSFQKTPDVDTPEDEHPLETLFALFVTQYPRARLGPWPVRVATWPGVQGPCPLS